MTKKKTFDFPVKSCFYSRLRSSIIQQKKFSLLSLLMNSVIDAHVPFYFRSSPRLNERTRKIEEKENSTLRTGRRKFLCWFFLAELSFLFSSVRLVERRQSTGRQNQMNFQTDNLCLLFEWTCFVVGKSARRFFFFRNNETDEENSRRLFSSLKTVFHWKKNTKRARKTTVETRSMKIHQICSFVEKKGKNVFLFFLRSFMKILTMWEAEWKRKYAQKDWSQSEIVLSATRSHQFIISENSRNFFPAPFSF